MRALKAIDALAGLALPTEIIDVRAILSLEVREENEKECNGSNRKQTQTPKATAEQSEKANVRIIGIANTAIETKVELRFITKRVHFLFTILAH
jgi:hypothetical protein